jgi:archaellin
MKNLIKKISTFAFVAFTTTSVIAADLGSFGIATLQPLSDQQAADVRGAGYASSESTAMTAMQVFIFDSAGGSSINLSSSSINSSSEYGNSSSDLDTEGSFVASATQSVSSISALDIAFGDFTLHTSDFALGAWGDSAASGSSILFNAFETTVEP